MVFLRQNTVLGDNINRSDIQQWRSYIGLNVPTGENKVLLLGPFTVFIPIILVSRPPMQERGWLAFHRWVIQTTWLFSACHALSGGYLLLPTPVGLSTCFVSRPFVSNLSVVSPFRPLAYPLTYLLLVLRNPCISLHQATFVPKNVNGQVYCSKLCLLGGLSLTTIFKSHPPAGLYCKSSPFSAIPTY